MRPGRILSVVLLILIAALSRLVPHPPNFTPILSIALFSGATLTNKRWAFLVPIAAILLGDFVIGMHDLAWLVYACVGFTVWMGTQIQERRSAFAVALCSFIGAIFFDVVANFGVWVTSGMYPLTFAGLTACYVAAIPFFQNTILSSLLFSLALFGSLAVLEKLVPSLRTVRMPS